ncbi:hypothetical protein C8R45DRAFT_931003 [Mycena sanguinolenta]|nr:hypothetical protein C8R45DRAFT_931003 [Mycena sanguinolenta]
MDSSTMNESASYSTPTDNRSITSVETIRPCAGVSTGPDNDADKPTPTTPLLWIFHSYFLKPILAAGAELRSLIGCGHKHIASDYGGDYDQHPTTTTTTAYEAHQQQLWFPSPDTSLTACTTPFWCRVTSERPLPLEPMPSPINVTDLRHQYPCMMVEIVDLPWGGVVFRTRVDEYVRKGDVFQLQGKLLGWWRAMQFQWERGGWAYVLMQDESRHAQVIIAIPHRRIRMHGPVPRIQYEANLNADCGMDRRRRVRQLPPTSTGAGAPVPSALPVWNEDTEGICNRGRLKVSFPVDVILQKSLEKSREVLIQFTLTHYAFDYALRLRTTTTTTHYDYDYALRLRIRTTTTTTTTTSTSTTTTHYVYDYDYDYNYAFAFDYTFAYKFPNDLLSVQLHLRYFDPLIDCHLTYCFDF